MFLGWSVLGLAETTDEVVPACACAKLASNSSVSVKCPICILIIINASLKKLLRPNIRCWLMFSEAQLTPSEHSMREYLDTYSY